jgi:hypothetical protein
MTTRAKEKELTEPTAKPLGSVRCAQLRKSVIAPGSVDDIDHSQRGA